MPDPKVTPENVNADGSSLLPQVEAALERFGSKIAEEMRQDREKVEELDARMAELAASGDETGHRWVDGLRRSRGGDVGATPTVRGWDGRRKLSVGELVERQREAAAHEEVAINGQMVPVLRTLPSRVRNGALSDPRGLRFCRVMRCHAAAMLENGGTPDYERAILHASEELGDPEIAGHLEQTRDLVRDLMGSDKVKRSKAQRALGTATLGSGGGLVDPELAAEIIDFLHPRAVVRSLGAQSIPMSSGQLSIPFMDTAATASYTSENAGPNEDSPGDARLNLVRRTLMAVVAISKELLRESSYSVDAFIRLHLARVMAAREDLAFMRGDGSQETPRGLTYWARQIAGHSFARSLDTGAVTIQTITDDITKAFRLIEDENVAMMSIGTIMKPRTYWGLLAKRNATTQVEIWPELRLGQWYGYPLRRTTQIPQNQAGDGQGNGTNNKAEIIVADFETAAIAETEAMEVNAFPGGAYVNANGNVASGITNRETVITAEAGHDFGCLLRGKEVVEITSVDYGA